MTTATTVNVPDLIDEQKVSSFQIRIMVLCALAALLDGFAAQMGGRRRSTRENCSSRASRAE